jgi:WD40 repeat protein
VTIASDGMNVNDVIRNRAQGTNSIKKRKKKRNLISGSIRTSGLNKTLNHISEEKFIQSQRAFSSRLPSATRSTYAITFCADRKYAAASTGDHHIHIIRINDGSLVKTLTGHTRTCWSVVFHPTNPNLLASGDLSAEVRVWDISDPKNGYEVWKHESGETQPHSKISISLSFHPTDNVLLIAVQNELRIWDWSKPKPFVTIKTNSEREKVSYIRLCPLGNRLITAIQQNNEINEVEHIIGTNLDETGRWNQTGSHNSETGSNPFSLSTFAGQAAGLSSRSSGHLTAGRIRHFPHPRNNEHPLRFSLRNQNFGMNQNQSAQSTNQNPESQNQPTNEEILQGINIITYE